MQREQNIFNSVEQYVDLNEIASLTARRDHLLLHFCKSYCLAKPFILPIDLLNSSSLPTHSHLAPTSRLVLLICFCSSMMQTHWNGNQSKSCFRFAQRWKKSGLSFPLDAGGVVRHMNSRHCPCWCMNQGFIEIRNSWFCCLETLKLEQMGKFSCCHRW